MTIESGWLDEEKTIFFGKFTGDWTWEEYGQSFIDTFEQVQGIDYRIDQIIDMTASGAIPEGPALVLLNRNSSLASSFKIGLTVLVGASPILRGIISTLSITNPNRGPRLFVDSIEEAIQLIKDDREKSKNANSGT